MENKVKCEKIWTLVQWKQIVRETIFPETINSHQIRQE